MARKFNFRFWRRSRVKVKRNPYYSQVLGPTFSELKAKHSKGWKIWKR